MCPTFHPTKHMNTIQAGVQQDFWSLLMVNKIQFDTFHFSPLNAMVRVADAGTDMMVLHRAKDRNGDETTFHKGCLVT